MKKNNKKGFTLAELLIVVAIIGVLVAISIPIFTAQLEKSRDAVSISNIRAAYAEGAAAYLTATKKADGTWNVSEDNVSITTNAAGADVVTVSGVELKGTKSSDNFSGLASQLPVSNASSLTEPAAGTYNAAFTYTTGSNVPSLTLSAATGG